MHPALFASITPDSMLHELPTENVEAPITFPIPRLAELFEARPGLAGVMIVDDVGFVGMLSRQTFTQEMARPHRRDLLRRRMVGELYRSLNPSALRLPSDTRIDDALKIALNRTDNRRYEPIVVDYRDQRPRLLDVYVLLLGQTAQLSAQNAACRAAVDTARAAEAKYRAIFENAVEGIFQTTPEGTYIAVNPALARMYGYDSAAELVQGIRDIAGQLYVNPFRRDEFIRLMERHGVVTGFESEARRRDGSRIWISENVRAVRDETGKLLFYEGTVEDITQNKTHEAYRQAKEAAEAANQAKSEFLANMSHEIRTPLHGILSFANFGVKKASSAEPAKLLEYFTHIQTSGQRLMSLVNDLLDLSKLEAGKMSFDFQPTNLIAVVACVHDEFASLLSERQLQVRFQRPAEPIVAEVDQTRIMQVVRNLVNNAVKFSPQHGTIDMEVRGGAGHVRVSVRDHGIGIPEGELELIFDKFVQSSKTKSGAGGTGLGLAICRQIVEGHGGRIWAEHADGGGALFTFDLPLTQTHRHAGDLAA